MSKAVTTRKATKPAKFKPSAKMNEYLNTALSLLTDSPKKIADNCGVNRKSWYLWQDVEGFSDWFYAEYAKKRRQIIPKLDQIGLKHASRGDFAFWKAMNQKVGELSEDPRQPSINVQVNNLLKDQQDKYKLD